MPPHQTPRDPRKPGLPPPVGVPVAHGVVTRVLLVVLAHLEAHLLAAAVVGPVHLALFADQWWGGGLLGQGGVTGPAGGGLCDGGQQPGGAETLNFKTQKPRVICHLEPPTSWTEPMSSPR